MSDPLSSRVYLLIMALLVLSGCSNSEPDAQTGQTVAAMPVEEMETPHRLSIIYPQADTELVGGQSVRMTAFLSGSEDQPVTGAGVTAQLWTPGGDLFAEIPCADKGGGRYLADPISLPLRGSQGTWRVTAQAEWGDGLTAQAEEQFTGLISYSERLQDLYGFWIELTDLFPYNVPNAEDPQLKTYSYEDGGYLILANNLTTGVLDSTFVILDVHWRDQDMSEDAKAAVDYVLDLAGPHRITLDISADDLAAEQTNFQGKPAWHVSGLWHRQDALGNPARTAPLDWMVFGCPGSDHLWAILITTNSEHHMDDLESIRGSFACVSE